MGLFKFLRQLSSGTANNKTSDTIILQTDTHRLYHGNPNGVPYLISDPSHVHDNLYANINHSHSGVYCAWLGKADTEPGNPIAGDIWVNSKIVPNVVNIYDGRAWIALN
jgi:hypothetical protein